MNERKQSSQPNSLDRFQSANMFSALASSQESLAMSLDADSDGNDRSNRWPKKAGPWEDWSNNDALPSEDHHGQSGQAATIFHTEISRSTTRR